MKWHREVAQLGSLRRGIEVSYQEELIAGGGDDKEKEKEVAGVDIPARIEPSPAEQLLGIRCVCALWLCNQCFCAFVCTVVVVACYIQYSVCAHSSVR